MIAADAVKQQDTQQLIFSGTEVSFYDIIALRVGYKFNYSGTSDDGTSERGSIDTTVEGISFGGGLQYEIDGYNVGIDYTFTKTQILFFNADSTMSLLGKAAVWSAISFEKLLNFS